MPDGFPLKSVVFKLFLISKEISRAEHEYMNIHPPPPPPINALGTALRIPLYRVSTILCHSGVSFDGVVLLNKGKSLGFYGNSLDVENFLKD